MATIDIAGDLSRFLRGRLVKMTRTNQSDAGAFFASTIIE